MSQPASERSCADDPGERGPVPEGGPGEPQRVAPDATPEVPPDRVVAINRATLRGVDFRKARFDSFALAGCVFISCDFRMIRFEIGRAHV